MAKTMMNPASAGWMAFIEPNDSHGRQPGGDLGQGYEILSSEFNQSWPWSPGRDRSCGHVNVAGDLDEAMSSNTRLKLLVGNGCYDPATPFFTADSTVHPPSRLRLEEGIPGFIEWATPWGGE